MFLRLLAAFLFLFFCGGCGVFLPPGDPPGGDIVHNPLPERLSHEEMILSLGSRIAASSMQYFPGAPVALDTDKESVASARTAVREAGKICGVRLEQAAAAVLYGRKTGARRFEFELFHFSRSLWRCSYELK